MKNVFIVAWSLLSLVSAYSAQASDKKSCNEALTQPQPQSELSSLLAQIPGSKNPQEIYNQMIEIRARDIRKREVKWRDVFNASAPSLQEDTLAALKAVEAKRNQGGGSVYTSLDRELKERVKVALAADPVTSPWSTGKRSELYWPVAASGRASQDVESAVLMARYFYDQALTEEQRSALNSYVASKSKAAIWDSLKNELRRSGLLGLSLVDLEAREREIFDRAVADQLFTRPSEQALRQALSAREHLEDFGPTLRPIAKARPLLNYVLLVRHSKGASPEARLLTGVYNEMVGISKQIVLTETILSPTPTETFWTHREEVDRNMNWSGFGDIYLY